jgi:hypothetical protein
MPKKPPRDNPRNRTPGTVQSAAAVLRRVMQRDGANIYLGNQIFEYFLTTLPEALRPHVLQVVERPGELVILADSAAWAARLRLALAGDPGLAGNRRTIIKVAPRGAAVR